MNWNITANDSAVVNKIVARAEQMGLVQKRLDAMMDITATHCNGCPLDLQAFLTGDDFDFRHDFAGIQRHIDRKTGNLRDCFLPRFAR